MKLKPTQWVEEQQTKLYKSQDRRELQLKKNTCFVEGTEWATRTLASQTFSWSSRLWALLSWREYWQHLLYYYRIDVFYKTESEIATSKLDVSPDVWQKALGNNQRSAGSPKDERCTACPESGLWKRLCNYLLLVPGAWFMYSFLFTQNGVSLGWWACGSDGTVGRQWCSFHSNLINISK